MISTFPFSSILRERKIQSSNQFFNFIFPEIHSKIAIRLLPIFYKNPKLRYNYNQFYQTSAAAVIYQHRISISIKTLFSRNLGLFTGSEIRKLNSLAFSLLDVFPLWRFPSLRFPSLTLSPLQRTLNSFKSDSIIFCLLYRLYQSVFLTIGKLFQ